MLTVFPSADDLHPPWHTHWQLPESSTVVLTQLVVSELIRLPQSLHLHSGWLLVVLKWEMQC